MKSTDTKRASPALPNQFFFWVFLKHRTTVSYGTFDASDIVSVKPKHSIRAYPCPSVAKNQPSKADRTSKKTSDLATDGHGYTRMRSVGFLALDREKIGTAIQTVKRGVTGFRRTRDSLSRRR